MFLDGKRIGGEFSKKNSCSESNRFNKNFKTLDFGQYSEIEIEENLFGKEINRIFHPQVFLKRLKVEPFFKKH